MNNRQRQLEDLHAHLGELIAVLTQDQACQWQSHFASCQQRAAGLLSQGFTQNDLNELSGSVNHVFGGSGSFNDYAPVVPQLDGTFNVIAGMERFDELSIKVYHSALALRVTGNVA
ncbi:hypothetical protein FHY12_002866 [Xanthomonas arboricola]|uniref:DUF6966 domain-containing protein n=1 Tax=Xanthomonas euroxanthea TaxID=2259622 RepID=UPI00141AE752|nr:hypothetical protein [Xanthomonas euroxanthea]NIK40541.1 hypothetical protein [Xanthomonas euroxanthea]